MGSLLVPMLLSVWLARLARSAAAVRGRRTNPPANVRLRIAVRRLQNALERLGRRAWCWIRLRRRRRHRRRYVDCVRTGGEHTSGVRGAVVRGVCHLYIFLGRRGLAGDRDWCKRDCLHPLRLRRAGQLGLRDLHRLAHLSHGLVVIRRNAGRAGGLLGCLRG